MSSTDGPRLMRRAAAKLTVDHRGKLDLAALTFGAAGYLAAARSRSFDTVLNAATRQSLYGSLATTSGALLGFALTSLAILLALPSTQRLDVLRAHPQWHRIPRAFFRAAWPLLALLVLCTLGITLDDGAIPARGYEAAVAAVTALSLAAVAGALVALDLVMEVARNTTPVRAAVNDPGL